MVEETFAAVAEEMPASEVAVEAGVEQASGAVVIVVGGGGFRGGGDRGGSGGFYGGRGGTEPMRIFGYGHASCVSHES